MPDMSKNNGQNPEASLPSERLIVASACLQRSSEGAELSTADATYLDYGAIIIGTASQSYLEAIATATNSPIEFVEQLRETSVQLCLLNDPDYESAVLEREEVTHFDIRAACLFMRLLSKRFAAENQ